MSGGAGFETVTATAAYHDDDIDTYQHHIDISDIATGIKVHGFHSGVSICLSYERAGERYSGVLLSDSYTDSFVNTMRSLPAGHVYRKSTACDSATVLRQSYNTPENVSAAFKRKQSEDGARFTAFSNNNIAVDSFKDSVMTQSCHQPRKGPSRILSSKLHIGTRESSKACTVARKALKRSIIDVFSTPGSFKDKKIKRQGTVAGCKKLLCDDTKKRIRVAKPVKSSSCQTTLDSSGSLMAHRKCHPVVVVTNNGKKINKLAASKSGPKLVRRPKVSNGDLDNSGMFVTAEGVRFDPKLIVEALSTKVSHSEKPTKMKVGRPRKDQIAKPSEHFRKSKMYSSKVGRKQSLKNHVHRETVRRKTARHAKNLSHKPEEVIHKTSIFVSNTLPQSTEYQSVDNRNENNTELSTSSIVATVWAKPNDIVWAKLGRSAWWPAKVERLLELPNADGAHVGGVLVRWYGSNSTSTLPADKLCDFLSTFSKRFTRKRRSNYMTSVRKAFAECPSSVQDQHGGDFKLFVKRMMSSGNVFGGASDLTSIMDLTCLSCTVAETAPGPPSTEDSHSTPTDISLDRPRSKPSSSSLSVIVVDDSRQQDDIGRGSTNGCDATFEQPPVTSAAHKLANHHTPRIPNSQIQLDSATTTHLELGMRSCCDAPALDHKAVISTTASSTSLGRSLASGQDHVPAFHVVDYN